LKAGDTLVITKADHVARSMTAADAEETEETSLTDELSALSLDLHNRWEGARFAINPRNPDAARHFCTSAREVIVELINMKAPDAAVLQAKPNCERGPDGKAVARREKIGYLLALNGAGYEALNDFVETNVNDVMNLFSQFNKGTHGTAGRFDIPTLRTIKHRVEDSIPIYAGPRLQPLTRPSTGTVRRLPVSSTRAADLLQALRDRSTPGREKG
jgi:hypothetical protein